MPSRHLWTTSIINELRAHSNRIDPKIINYDKSKLSMWQDIADLHMNKRND
jgi:hypothetical protein